MQPRSLGRYGLIALSLLALCPARSLAQDRPAAGEPAAAPAGATAAADAPPPAAAAPVEAKAEPAADSKVAPAAAATEAAAPAAGPAANAEPRAAEAKTEPAAGANAEPAPEAKAESAADPEREAPVAGPSEAGAEARVDPKHRYSGDIDDVELEKRWKEDPSGLGPLSIGFADAGRLVNGLPFPEGPLWTVLDPGRHYGTQDLIEGVSRAIEEVNAVFPGSPRLGVGHISKQDGGWLRPHISHQAGRDVDLVFYYEAKRGKRGERIFDTPRNWALLRALITEGDVHFVLVDKRLIKKLYDHALAIGEDKEWLRSIFRNGMGSLVFHARRHRDHFHVRYYSGRAQELGRRVQPLLPKGKPEYNVAIHKVRKGDNLGSIARKYDTTVARVRKANALKGNLIRAGTTLHIPLGTACTDCPVPPEVVVPPRRLPPSRPAALAISRAEPVLEPAVARPADAPQTEPLPAGERLSEVHQ